MTVRTRFAPSPTGSLHLGSALSALANRRRGDWFLLRIDDTDRARDVPGAVEAIADDLRWLGVAGVVLGCIRVPFTSSASVWASTS